MPATKQSQHSKRKDAEIHEALVSGLSPAQVAARFDLAVEQVTAAHNRVLAARDKLAGHAAEFEAQRVALRVMFRVAIDGYRESNSAPEETLQVSTDTAKGGHKATRITKKKRADPRFLRVALWALAQERSLLKLEDLPAEPDEQTKLWREEFALMKQRMLENPDDICDDYLHACDEFRAGKRLPRIDSRRNSSPPQTSPPRAPTESEDELDDLLDPLDHDVGEFGDDDRYRSTALNG